MVLVPLSGFSYLNRNILKDLQVTYDVLVPLSGFSYLNCAFLQLDRRKDKKVLVPLSGFSYLNACGFIVKPNFYIVLVPLSGFSYLNPVPYTSQNTRLLSPICGANPQMREISISNWCITFSKPDFKPIGAKSLYFLKFNPPPSPYDTAFPDTLYIYRHAVPV